MGYDGPVLYILWHNILLSCLLSNVCGSHRNSSGVCTVPFYLRISNIVVTRSTVTHCHVFHCHRFHTCMAYDLSCCTEDVRDWMMTLYSQSYWVLNGEDDGGGQNCWMRLKICDPCELRKAQPEICWQRASSECSFCSCARPTMWSSSFVDIRACGETKEPFGKTSSASVPCSLTKAEWRLCSWAFILNAFGLYFGACHTSLTYESMSEGGCQWSRWQKSQQISGSRGVQRGQQ